MQGRTASFLVLLVLVAPFVLAIHATAFQSLPPTTRVSHSRNRVGFLSKSLRYATLEKSDEPSVESSSSSSSAIQDSSNHDDDDLTLIPLSQEPMLLVSSKPLLSPQECQLLARYFQDGSAEREQKKLAEADDVCIASYGRRLLDRVRRQVDALTLCPSHAGERPLPRFLTYHDYDSSSSCCSNLRLVPDGLHVDTNNGKWFRHVTALLYLTSNNSGATTFPLAQPLQNSCSSSSSQHNYRNEDQQEEQGKNEYLDAAQLLLNHHHNIQHTLADGAPSEPTRRLHEAARDLFLADTTSSDDDDTTSSSSSTTTGIRVLPEAGKLCVFCNLLNSGFPDPTSFHGGEQQQFAGETKMLLSFFKEIPMESFGNRQEFGERVAETRRALQERYYHVSK